PDILIGRSSRVPEPAVKRKLSLFSGVAEEAIAMLPNADSIYEVPLTLEAAGIADVLTEHLGLKAKKPNLKDWETVVRQATTEYLRTVKVGFVAKYMDNTDTYMSVFEALKAAAWHNRTNIDITWIDASEYDGKGGDIGDELRKYDGIVVPGGFGQRSLEGKIRAAQYALKHKLPYLGLCLGLQMGVIAAARNGGLKQATSFELEPDSPDQLIVTMADQVGKHMTGGTMRLGNYDCRLTNGSLAHKVYGTADIVERH